MRHLLVTASSYGRDNATKQLPVTLELVIRLVKLIEISTICDLASLVSGSIVATLTSSGAASAAGLTTSALKLL